MREFYPGEVWRSPKGNLYLVVSVNINQAKLRKGHNGSGRVVYKMTNRTRGWERIYDYLHGESK